MLIRWAFRTVVVDSDSLVVTSIVQMDGTYGWMGLYVWLGHLHLDVIVWTKTTQR